MGRERTFFGVFGQIVKNSVRWIIRVGRRYQILPATFLVVFFVVLINMGNQPANLPTSTPPRASAPSANLPPLPNNVPNSSVPSYPAPVPPAIAVASVKAYKSGDNLTIRFDQPVADVLLVVDEQGINADCKPIICTVLISPEAMKVRVSWSQDGERFVTNFRL